ncbi:MAG TPA: CHAT domain-containing protein [Pyrinomonadaceae bacterium]|nr:CHAT domain-containing protein [Pyrinomonadaceae bacterium]
MELNLAKEFQSESLQHAESLSALLQEVSALTQNGRAEAASDIYQRGHRELQIFHDKWRTKVKHRDPSFAALLEQQVRDSKVSLFMSEAVTLRFRGKSDDALSLLKKALELVPTDSFEHASLLQSIGGLRYDQQAFEQAEELGRRAHTEFARLAATADPDYAAQFWAQAAQTLGESAFAAFGRGDYATFQKTLDEAIHFAEQHGLEQVANKLWIRQVGQMLHLEASGETIQRVKLERRRRSKHSEPGFQYEVSQLIAHSCAAQGEYKLARQELEEARENVPPHHRWSWLRQLADLAELDGDIAAALDCSQQALTEARRIGVPQTIAAALRALVPLLADQNPSESDRCLSELLEFGDRDEIKNALVGRAIFHLNRKNFEAALMDLSEAEKSAPGDANILLGRVAVYKGMGSKEEALQITDQAVAALEDQIRQSGIDLKSGFESLAGLQESAAFWTAELGRTEEAFHRAEMSKAYALRSRLLQTVSPNTGGSVSYAAVQERLANESAGLVFFCFASRGGLALLCDGELAKPEPFFLDVTESSLRELLPDQESERWNQGVFGAIDKLSEKFAILLSEIRRKGYKKLYVVPDSQLYFVPFYALNFDGDSKVIDHCAVAYLPCAEMLLSSTSKEERARVCLAAGALQEHGISLSDQAAQVAGLDWTASECLVEATARELLDKAPAFNVLHLQFHGRVEGSVQGSRSASILKLSDRPISASEIRDLSLDAELVFLNACVSGRFKSRISNDVGGFWEAFLQAGAKRIIATLTYVDPESAQLVALAFYRHWLNGLDCAEALRQAQLEVRQERPELDNWATHILIGS